MSSGETAGDRQSHARRANSSRDNFPSNGANRPNELATRAGARGAPARGRGNDRGRGRGAGSSNGAERNSNWRAGRSDSGASTPALDYGATVDFGGDPSAFGTPAFTGGATSSSDSDPFGGAFDEPAVKTTPSNQISTLEVLGEDSESRRKRFESTLSHNRYLELKPLREAQRIADVKSGLIPDPLKPMRLDEATDFLGTCEEMCPEWEREEREYQKSVEIWERYPGTYRIDPAIAVKAFHRPAAGNEQPLPSDVRPPHILVKTLDYLFHTLLPSQPLHLTHPFLRDRTRSVRQDLTMQNARGRLAIECNERIARYHILALGALREQVTFSESQELEQLRKVLKSLNEFYDDARIMDPPLATPNEPEFRAYNILTHLRDPDIIWSTELLPLPVFSSPLLQSAIRLHSLAQTSNSVRGEKVSPNAWSRFFKLLGREEIPYLFACILSTHFNDIRIAALKAMKSAYIPQHSAYSLRMMARVLGCDDEEEASSLCESCGLRVDVSEAGVATVELHKNVILLNGVIKGRVSQRLVEAKRGKTPYADVIDGIGFAPNPVSPLPPTPSSHSTSLTRISPPAPRLAPAAVAAAIPKARPQFSLGLGAAPPTAPFASSPLAQVFVPPTAPSAFSASPFANTQPTLSPFSTPFVPASIAAVVSVPSPFSQQPPVNAFASTSRLPSATLPAFAIAPPPTTVHSISPPHKRTPSSSSPRAPSISALRSASKPAPRKVSIPLPAPIAGPNRSKILSALIANIVTELLITAISPLVRRIAERTLREMWARITAEEVELRGRNVEAITKRMWDEVLQQRIGLDVGRLCWVEVRNRRSKGKSLLHWDRRTKELMRAREEERARIERIREFEQIALEGNWKGKERAYDDESEDELDGLGLGALSIGALDLDRLRKEGEVADREMAQKALQAQEIRETLWAPGTFLELLASRIDLALPVEKRPARARYDAVVSCGLASGPFGTWLACKFGSEGDRFVELETDLVEIRVSLVDDASKPLRASLENAGLVIFECTLPVARTTDLSSFWSNARDRLKSLLDGIEIHSIYRPHLLIISCAVSPDSDEQLRSAIHKELVPGSNATIAIINLDSADTQFADALASMIKRVVRRPEKVLLPASNYSKPLLGLLNTALAQSLRSFPNHAGIIVTRFINLLDLALQHSSSCLVPTTILPPLPRFVSLPGESISEAVRDYISQSTFDLSTDFPMMDSVLSSRPPPSDIAIIRLLLEYLAEFISAQLARKSIRQESIDSALPVSIRTISRALDSTVEEISEEVARSNGAVEREREKKKKRKASVDPSDHSGHEKKKSISEINFGGTSGKRTGDDLSALSALMKDAQLLLSTS